MRLSIDQIARITHEANRAYCETLGDTSQKPWEQAEQWQRDSAVNGVQFVLNSKPTGADLTGEPRRQHDNWMSVKLKEGWRYGPVKDAEAKTHPCLLPYNELPPEQKLKDALFRAVAETLAELE